MRSMLVISLAAAVLAGCRSSPPVPDTAAIYAQAAQHVGDERVPVVVIPGILGSKLADEPTGTRVWGAFVYGAADADTPAGARLISLPMQKGVPLAQLSDDVVATEALDAIKFDTLGFVRGVTIDAYAGILRTLAVGKYRDETLARGAGVDYAGTHYTCVQYAYDWRRDISEAAVVLGDVIHDAQQAARDARGLDPDEPVRVDVVAHSMGGLVLRYFLRYGDAPLPDDGSLPDLTWAGAEHVRWAVLVGTPSAGSVRSVEQLVDGWNLNPIAPNYRALILGTMPAVYQLLPRTRHGRVVDEETNEPIDLYDPAVWERFGWGLASPDADRHLAWLLPGLTPMERHETALDHLQKCLAKAEQLHRALDAPAVPPAGMRIVLFAGDAEPTPDVLAVDSEGRLSVVQRTAGDGTVTRSSALMDERVGRAWTPQLTSPVAWSQVRFLADNHFGLTKSPAFTDNLLYLLLESPEAAGHR